MGLLTISEMVRDVMSSVWNFDRVELLERPELHRTFRC